MKKRIGSYPRVRVEGGGRGVVSQAGADLLVETVRKSGLDAAISAALAPWRKARAVHDPGKILLDVALTVALGGDCLADLEEDLQVPAARGRAAKGRTAAMNHWRGTADAKPLSPSGPARPRDRASGSPTRQRSSRLPESATSRSSSPGNRRLISALRNLTPFLFP